MATFCLHIHTCTCTHTRIHTHIHTQRNKRILTQVPAHNPNETHWLVIQNERDENGRGLVEKRNRHIRSGRGTRKDNVGEHDLCM